MKKDFGGSVAVRMYTGRRYVFASLAEAVRWVDYPRIKYRKQDGRFRPTYLDWLYDSCFNDVRYIPPSILAHGYCELRDECGLLISDTRIEMAIAETGVRWWCMPSWYRQRNRLSRYRRPEGGHDPKAKAGKHWRRKSNGSHTRRYLAAARDLEALLDNEDLREINCRVKVRKSMVFNPWDDERDRSDWDAKSWKRHRRNQYRERPQGRS